MSELTKKETKNPRKTAVVYAGMEYYPDQWEVLARKDKSFILWGDIETGGLDGRLENGKLGMEDHPILELAFIVTDPLLNEIGDPLRLVIHHSEDTLNNMSDWSVEQHTKSGLLDEVRQSDLTLAQAEREILCHLKQLGIDEYHPFNRSGPIFAGNSIKLDRNYIMCQMPKLHKYLHYRQFDLSAIALAMRYWNKGVADQVKKNYDHTALADIRESIEEARTYMKALRVAA